MVILETISEQQHVAYQKLERKVQEMIAKGIRLKTITIEEAIAVLFLFSQTTNIFDLETFIEMFADSFPFLRQLAEEKASETKNNLESKVREHLEKIVKTDPLTASLITQKALQPGMTWDELVLEFPELEQ